MGVKHTVLPDGQRPTVAFTVLAQLCGPKANETEMEVALFTKNVEGRDFDFDFLYKWPLENSLRQWGHAIHLPRFGSTSSFASHAGCKPSFTVARAEMIKFSM